MWARRLVTETLRAWDWDCAERRDDAVLLTNELVANVAEHTAAPSLLLELGGKRVWFELAEAPE